MSGRKNKPPSNAARLLRQINKASQDFRSYGLKKIRFKSHHETLWDFKSYDFADRSCLQRCWKEHRKTQWLEKR